MSRMQQCPLCGVRAADPVGHHELMHGYYGSNGPRQTALFESRVDENRLGLAHRAAADTERAAAVAVMPRSGTQRARVYEAIHASQQRGMTDWELVDTLSVLRSSVCARRNELIREGLVIDSGRRRKERTGSHAIVWVTTHRKV